VNRTIVKIQWRNLEDKSVVEAKFVVFHTPGKLPLEVVHSEYDFKGYAVINVEEQQLTPGFSIQLEGHSFNRGYTKGDRDGKTIGIRDEIH
jgi:hypothetical protein